MPQKKDVKITKLPTMNISRLNYKLPEKNIAHHPANPRESAKLLVVNRETNKLEDKNISDIVSILPENSVLVLNNSKVIPAKLTGHKNSLNGVKRQILLTKEVKKNVWESIHKGSLKVDDVICFSKDELAKVIDKNGLIIKLQFTPNSKDIINKYGELPIPPYIKYQNTKTQLSIDYQTKFAKHPGSVAAPTAGLHFTNEILKKIKDKGIQIEFVTLHVGLGTFFPIKEQELSKHTMHEEFFELSEATAANLNKAKTSGKKIIAVGTTATRVLESSTNNLGMLEAKSGATDIFIYPPYKFKFIDQLITNFHLPKSTLLALVSAFSTFPNTKSHFESFEKTTIGEAYQHAIKNNYRFYSFGDAMYIL